MNVEAYIWIINNYVRKKSFLSVFRKRNKKMQTYLPPTDLSI